MSELRITCPHCQTSYTRERCGLNDKVKSATVLCGLCSKEFDFSVQEKELPTTQGWWPWLFRRPIVPLKETIVESRPR
jgi:predicted Zn finger-like uncharacterized protein